METILLKCGYCGAAIDLDEISLESRICKCKYCKKTVLIPKDRGQVKNWYNRAEELRAACEFDRAIDVYEKILTEDNTDPQAHWGMALSKCGIEFVLDGKTGEYLPTCHRTTEQTILGEPEYQAALEHAEASQRAVIEAEAQKIHEIQKKILSISKQEQPYDVFISYKEEDEQKNRTKDSVLAQQIYDELKKKNYRVFYARKTLEGKLGSEYEPIIYAALSSAKVMVVVGTKPEHFKATWVRNEWRRFQLMGKDGGKTIIPAYRDMYPDELPPELSALTALDMAKIGFLQELVDGVGRTLGARASGTEEGTAGIGRERLAKNGETYLKLQNYDLAEEAYTSLTKSFPEDYRGWWGRIICRTRNFSNPTSKLGELNEWYGYTKQLSPASVSESFESQYVSYLQACSNVAAAEDIQTVQNQIGNHQQNIRALRVSIQQNDSKIQTISSSANQSLAQMDTQTENEKTIIANKQDAIRSETLKMWFGWGVLILGVLIVFVGVANSSFGVVLIGALIIYGGYSLLRNTSRDYIASLKNQVRAAETRISQLQTNKAMSIQNSESQISGIKQSTQQLGADIQKIESAIGDCRKYLAIGQRQIADMFFSDMCKDIDVDQPSDSSTRALRNAVYSSGTARNTMNDDEISFSCPACGNRITGSRSKLRASGYVNCKKCGTRLEINS